MFTRFGPLRLTISLSVSAGAERTWEASAAIGLSDQELVQLNGRNTRAPESATSEQRHQLLVSGPWPQRNAEPYTTVFHRSPRP